MTEEEIRLDCLRLAYTASGLNGELNVVETAQSYYDFVMGKEKSKPEPLKAAA